MVCKALSEAKRLSSLPRSQATASADRRRSGVQANPEARFRGGEAHAGRGQPQSQPTSRDRARPLRNTGERGDLPKRACRSGFCFFFPKEKEEVFPRKKLHLSPPQIPAYQKSASSIRPPLPDKSSPAGERKNPSNSIANSSSATKKKPPHPQLCPNHKHFRKIRKTFVFLPPPML